MIYGKLENNRFKELNLVYIEHNGTIYTNPLNNPNINLKELGYKPLVVDNMPTYDQDNEKVIMFYQDKGNAIHRCWRVEPLTEQEKQEREKWKELT